MTEQERMKQGYVWQDDDENMSLQAHTKALVREFTAGIFCTGRGNPGSFSDVYRIYQCPEQ